MLMTQLARYDNYIIGKKTCEIINIYLHWNFYFLIFQSDHEYESAAEDSALEESDVELDKEIDSPTSNNTVDPIEKDQQTSIDKVTSVLEEVKIVEDNLEVDEVLELHSDKGKKISESAAKFLKPYIFLKRWMDYYEDLARCWEHLNFLAHLS